MTADALTALLTDLVASPSVGGTEDEVLIQRRLAERLGDLGLHVDLWPLDLAALRTAEGYPGEEVDRVEAWGLVASNVPFGPSTGSGHVGTGSGHVGTGSGHVGTGSGHVGTGSGHVGTGSADVGTGSGDVGLVLQGHVDVVPAGDREAWSGDPFTPVVRGGDLVGRGTCDMKGGVAAILEAVRTLPAPPSELPPFAVHLVIGEEDGGLGAFATLQRGHTGAACVIPEPTDLELVTANAGALTFRIEIPGLATHGSTAYAGVSAIDAYLPLHSALADLSRRRNENPEPLMRDLPVAYPLSVGRLRAGDWASSVPDLLVAEGRYGLRIEEEPIEARAELEAALQDAADRDPWLRDHPPVVTWPGGQFRGGHLPSGHVLRQRVAQAHAAVTGADLGPERGAPYGSDLRLYAGAGIATLHYGPGDVRLAHGPDERVPLVQVGVTAAVLGRMLVEGVPT